MGAIACSDSRGCRTWKGASAPILRACLAWGTRSGSHRKLKSRRLQQAISGSKEELRLPDDSSGGGAGDEAKVLKNARFEDAAGSAASENWRNTFADFAVYAPHLLNGGLFSGPRKGVAQYPKNSPNRSLMNMRICSDQVAQG